MRFKKEVEKLFDAHKVKEWYELAKCFMPELMITMG
jgi:hypothetical protein